MAIFGFRRQIPRFSQWDNNKPLLTSVCYKSAYFQILDLITLQFYETLYLDGEALNIQKPKESKPKAKKAVKYDSSGLDPMVYATIKDYLKREFMKYWEEVREDVDEIDIQDEYEFAKLSFVFYMVKDSAKKEVRMSVNMPENTKGFVVKLSPKIE